MVLPPGVKPRTFWFVVKRSFIWATGALLCKYTNKISDCQKTCKIYIDSLSVPYTADRLMQNSFIHRISQVACPQEPSLEYCYLFQNFSCQFTSKLIRVIYLFQLLWNQHSRNRFQITVDFIIYFPVQSSFACSMM